MVSNTTDAFYSMDVAPPFQGCLRYGMSVGIVLLLVGWSEREPVSWTAVVAFLLFGITTWVVAGLFCSAIERWRSRKLSDAVRILAAALVFSIGAMILVLSQRGFWDWMGLVDLAMFAVVAGMIFTLSLPRSFDAVGGTSSCESVFL